MLTPSSLLFAGFMALPTPVVLPAGASLQADQLAQLAPLQALMQTADAESGLLVNIAHPGGEAGAVRAEQLRAALVALGLGSKRIVLTPQSLDEPILILTLEKSTP